MIHEDIIISGSFQASGSFILPRIPSNSLATATTGSMFYDTVNDVVKIYTGTGSNEGYVILGEQTTPAAAPADIEYLLVAGGGAGGSGFYGAGGGAGGLLSSSLASVVSGSSFTLTVGSGGSSGTTTSGGRSGGDGNDSSIAGATISTITSTGGGGGGGGGATTSTTADVTGNDGGSGGGAAQDNPYTAGPGSGTVGQGNDGGDTNSFGYGAGGGGASAAGGSGTSSGGNGGDGKQSNITGTATYYAGGGGGADNSGTGGTGGQGGGATGDDRFSGTPGAGTANTGGGGAGAGDVSEAGGAGGSGVVIFAYDSGSVNGAGGIVGDAGNGRKYHQFNASDTFKVGSTSDFQIVTDSLLLHYDAGNFDSRGASTVTDLSGNGYNGTTVNSPTLNNYSYTFNGSNTYINTNNQLLSNNSSFSYSLWIKFSTSQSGRTLLGRHNDASGGASIGIDDGTANKVKFHLNDYSTQRVNSTGTINDGNWKYLVGTWDTSTLKLYINGSLDNSATPGSASLTFPSLNMQIGRWVGGNSQYFNGNIAMIHIYTKALSAAEVLQNYNATKTNFV